jgi:non-heme chloroperoxidase
VAADVDPDLAAVLASSQRPLAGLAFAEKATAAAWKTKPAWAVVSSSDTTINPDVQRFGYRRAGIDFVEIDSSHMVMLSHPDEVVDIIIHPVHRARGPARTTHHRTSHTAEEPVMSTVTTPDGTVIFYKDWGPRDARPIVFHHGWPLSSDDWDAQLLFFLSKGYRVIAHDRRGHGRSSQSATGHDMDTYVADVNVLTDALDLQGAVHVGHSTGGGEVTRYVAQAKPGRVSKAVLVAAVPPVMVKKDSNPEGTPIEVFDGFRAALAANRAQFFIDVPAGPFYGFNRPGAEVSQGLIDRWWWQGMMGAANAHYECIKAFSETDFTEDLKKIDVPVLVMHGTDDQVVPYADSGPKSAELLKNGTLKSYEGYPHGMLSTHPDVLNADILAFVES